MFVSRAASTTLRVRLLVTGVCAAFSSRASLSSASQSARSVLSTAGQSVSSIPSATKSQFSTMSDDDKKPTFDPSDLKKRLSDIEYTVTQEKATEPAFTGKYLKNKKPGTYTCVVCSSKLFSSHHKFESGCGWPAFSEVLTSAAVKLTADRSYGMTRTEVTCAHCGAHLGHVFDDGPPPARTRYCINSASMSFTPAEGGTKDEL